MATFCCAGSTAHGQLTQTDRDKLGLTKLSDALGSLMPTGAGVPVTQVEAPLTPGGSNYVPIMTVADLLGDLIIDLDLTGTSSTHATGVAQAFYGANGVAPGVSQISVSNANLWTNSSFLRTNNWRAPLTTTSKVINHSWVGSYATDSSDGVAIATDFLRRIDYVVNRDQVVMVAGVNNGVSPFPQILGNAYNAIAVGLSSGNSSPGPSTIDVAGRTKPDIVVPASNTSIGTAWVSGAAALLIETAEQFDGSGPAVAARPETIKALLLAGAVKTPFDRSGATATTFDDWSHTPEHPLDYQYGAGQMNVFNSFLILAAGQQAGGDENVSATGWDLPQLESEGTAQYSFEIPQGYVAPEMSIIATWNRQIDFKLGVSYNPAKLTPSLANVDLFLNSIDGSSAGEQIASSVSSIDNVEHIYQNWLTAGKYEISLTSDIAADVALAWRANLVLLGDATNDGVVDIGDYTSWADNFLKSNATWGEGDFSLDGIVDIGDYTIWADNFLEVNTQFSAVPEPGTLTLALIAAAVVVAGRRRNWRRSR